MYKKKKKKMMMINSQCIEIIVLNILSYVQMHWCRLLFAENICIN